MTRDILSVFCGAGGLDRGFSAAGFKTTLAIDSSADAVCTFNYNAKREVAIQRDLSSLKPDAFLELLPRDSHPVGFIGGPPCQGFSRGNVVADPADPRNLLPYRYAAFLKAANQRFGLHFFVFENVAGLLYSKHVARFERIKKKLCDAGFNVFPHELDASRFAVPQRRRRLFVVGLNSTIYRNVEFCYPEGVSEKNTVANAIAGLPKPLYFRRGLSPSEIPYHPNHWTMLPKSPKFKSAKSMTSGARSFRRLSWMEISPTVAYGNREIHVHPDGDRRLSVHEAMLLQGFPKEYTLTGSLSAQITQVSNAVPPPVAKAIAESIRNLIDSKALTSLETGAAR